MIFCAEICRKIDEKRKPPKPAPTDHLVINKDLSAHIPFINVVLTRNTWSMEVSHKVEEDSSDLPRVPVAHVNRKKNDSPSVSDISDDESSSESSVRSSVLKIM